MFNEFLKNLSSTQNFSVTRIPELKSVEISEVNGNGRISIRYSDFDYPNFYNPDTNKKYNYNQALEAVVLHAFFGAVYASDIKRSISIVTDHRVYTEKSSTNSVNKDKCTYVMVDSDWKPYGANERERVKFLSEKLIHLPIIPSSEKPVSEGVFALSTSLNTYTGIGFQMTKTGYKSIFPNASNIAARLKSFLLPDTIKIVNPSRNYFVGGDSNSIECLVAFVRPGEERHVSGEIWINEDTLNSFSFVQRKTVYYTETNLSLGDYCDSFDDVVLITHSTNNGIIPLLLSLSVIEKTSTYMVIDYEYKLNEARCVSHTGIKGYSVKTSRGDIGTIIVGDDTIVPDMVVGPSSAKGKVNQILLAKALYAHRYIENDYLSPDEMIDSLNEELINNLAALVPSSYWVSPSGEVVDCHYGLVNVSFTDPSLQYSRNGYMAFPFEMLKVAKIEYPDLYSAILESRDPFALEVTKEITYLQQSLTSSCKLPLKVINQKDIGIASTHKYFSPRIGETELLPVSSFLLEADRDPMIVNLNNGKRLYLPSGKVLLSFQSQTFTGNYSYDNIVVHLSRVLFSKDPTRAIEGLSKVVSSYMLVRGNHSVLKAELYGCSLKQVTLYDYENTVMIPPRLYKKAIKKIYPDYEGELLDVPLYSIVVRNPA